MPAASAASMASTSSCRFEVERVDVALGRRHRVGRPPGRGARRPRGSTARRCCGGAPSSSPRTPSRAGGAGSRSARRNSATTSVTEGKAHRSRRHHARLWRYRSTDRAASDTLAGRARDRARTHPRRRRPPRTHRRATSAAPRSTTMAPARSSSSWPRKRSVRRDASDLHDESSELPIGGAPRRRAGRGHDPRAARHRRATPTPIRAGPRCAARGAPARRCRGAP